MATCDYSRVQHFVGTRLARFLGNSYFNSSFFARLPGGNSPENAPPSSVRDFVKEHGGHTVITKARRYSSILGYLIQFLLQVLIANNGMHVVLVPYMILTRIY